MNDGCRFHDRAFEVMGIKDRAIIKKKAEVVDRSAGQTARPHGNRIGRPTLDQAGTIDAAILEAATRLFLDKGYDGTSMEAVALAAGISKRTLYLRYSTKSDLIKAVVKERVARWAVAASANNLGRDKSFRDRLTRHAETLVHALGDEEVRDFDRLSKSTAARFPELAKYLYDVGYRYELDFLTNEIREGTSCDPVPARDPELIARQLLSMITGWRRTEEMVRDISAAEATEFARNAVKVLFSGREIW